MIAITFVAVPSGSKKKDWESGVGDICAISVEGRIGVVVIDSPPVNALGINVRRALDDAFRAFASNPQVEAIVLMCGGRTFFAGADITEFGKPPIEPTLHVVADLIENGAKPVIAAIHGTALGGGYELALNCHYRIAVPSAKVGLPEVKLGLLPGAGGTQRVPRMIGAAAALEIIVSGAPVPAARALELGLVDSLGAEGRLREDAVAFAEQILRESRPLQRVRDRQDKVDPDKGNRALFDDFRRKNARTMRGFKAPENIIRAIEAAVELPFEEGIQREAELFQDLHHSVESAAQRYYFFAEREASKIPDVPPTTPAVPIATIGVIGAGTMGGGIAMNFLNAGLPVTLVEQEQAALDRGVARIRQNYENSAKRGKLTVEQVEQRMRLITPALMLDTLAQADLVIEAVFEQMDIKKQVFGALDRIAKPGAILASNTSFLDLDEIAAATSRPEQVIGLHFFSPANVMRLLEIVRGAKTSNEVIATAIKLAKAIDKAPVLSRVCPGFIANRVMAARSAQADTIILEGVSPQAVDQALYDYGFAMGHFQMMDLVGLDVIGRDAAARSVGGDLVGLGRLGQKQNGGYYDYDDKRTATPSPIATQVIADLARDRGVTQHADQSADEIVARLLYPVINEGAKLLEEGMAIRASDVDVACVLGYNWPVFTGGPMFWADTVGLPKIVAALDALEQQHGAAFAPATLLRDKAAAGGSFTRN